MLSNLISAIASGNSTTIASTLLEFLFYLIAILLSLSVHETAHGYIAYKCGDSTARDLGRLTLNPLKHMDPFGFICMMIAGFGWAKPVPVNSRNFRKPRRDMALVAIAGPISNLLLAILFVAIFRITFFPLNSAIVEATLEANALKANLLIGANQFIAVMITINVTLAIFNLLPVPPLDGSKLLYMILPPKAYFKIAPYEKYIYIVFIILLVTDIITPAISYISGTVTNLLLNLFFW